MRGMNKEDARTQTRSARFTRRKQVIRLHRQARHGVRVGQNTHLDITFTHQEIADMVRSTRQTVTSVLSQFQKRGLMRLENRRIYIESSELMGEITSPDSMDSRHMLMNAVSR